MRASLIIIGTELTRGIIKDAHGPLVSRELTNIGIHMSQIVELPDDGSIESVLETLLDKNDILIITGGLGPTADDMTRAAIARTARVELIKDFDCWEVLLRQLGSRAYGANERQAYIPKGFSVIKNTNGTASGFYGYADNTLIVSLPGPPREMTPMFYDSVLPLLRSKLNRNEELREEYSSFITAEARLEELCEEADSKLDWATRFQDYKISLYVSGGTKDERDRAIEKIRSRVGIARLVSGDIEAIDILIATLLERKATIGCAESCSGGVASSLLTSRAGASSYMLGSITSYSPEVKIRLLGVDKSIVERFGVVSRECAFQMADGARRALASDYSFSITGVAGPDKSEGKEVGTVCFGFSGKNMSTQSVKIHLNGFGRESIRRRSSVIAFILMDRYIKGEDIEAIAKSWQVF